MDNNHCCSINRYESWDLIGVQPKTRIVTVYLCIDDTLDKKCNMFQASPYKLSKEFQFRGNWSLVYKWFWPRFNLHALAARISMTTAYKLLAFVTWFQNCWLIIGFLPVKNYTNNPHARWPDCATRFLPKCSTLYLRSSKTSSMIRILSRQNHVM